MRSLLKQALVTGALGACYVLFKGRFSPQRLLGLSGIALLETMHLHADHGRPVVVGDAFTDLEGETWEMRDSLDKGNGMIRATLIRPQANP